MSLGIMDLGAKLYPTKANNPVWSLQKVLLVKLVLATPERPSIREWPVGRIDIISKSIMSCAQLITFPLF